MKDKKLAIVFDVTRYVLYSVLIISMLVSYISNRPSLFVFGVYSLYLLGAYYLTHAIVLKKSQGPSGIEVGKKNDAYLYFGVLRFLIFIILGLVAQVSLTGNDSNSIIKYGAIGTAILLLSTYTYRGFIVRRK